MKKKMLGLLLSTAMLATTVAGCGSTAATTASAPAAEETAKTEAAESTAADTADTEQFRTCLYRRARDYALLYFRRI